MTLPHLRWSEYGTRVASSLTAGLLAALFGLACVPDSERAAEHRESGEQFLLENRKREAMFEFHRAAHLQPNDVDLNLRAAEVSTELGLYSDAAEFYREALATRPDDLDISFRLARLLLKFDPAASRKIADELLEADPQNARAWIIRAELSLLENDTATAKAHVLRARRIAPEEPEVEWVSAQAEEEIGRVARFRNPLAAVSSRHWRGILSAYDRYLAKGGERRLGAALRRARALDMVYGRKEEAHEAHRDLLDQIQTSDSRFETLVVLSAVYQFAIGIGDLELAQRATTLWTELVPDDPVAWRHHASVLYSATPPEKQDAAFRQLLEDSGNTPAAHVVYAGYLTRKSGFRSGLEYLRGQLTETPGDAPLLVAIVALQQASGRLRDSAKSLAKLEQRFPDDAMLPLSMAQQALLSEDYDRVEAIISEVPSESRTAHLYRILARVQLKRHLDKEALKTLHTATALSPGVDPESLRLKAQIYLNLREYRKAASTLARVAKVSPLSPREQAVRGGSYYDARMPGLGRTILSQVLEREPGNTEVALELYRRDGTNPHHWDFLRKILEQALDSNPDNRKILTALTRLDLEAGQVDRALARVEEIIGRANWVGYPYLVRARIYLVTRRLKLAAHDAKRALLLDPKLVEESFEMEARAYLASGDPSGPITALEEAAREGRLSADRLALLARLRLHSGNPQRALAVYEQALAQGSQLNHVKNDLAVLLAESKNDLERAEALALAAVEAPGEQINAIDTLGYVYLAQGLPDAAYWKFRYAIANAETPNAEYHYHLALALVALQREAEAREALAVALELDPRFEPARDLHTRLRPDPSAVDNPSAEAS